MSETILNNPIYLTISFILFFLYVVLAFGAVYLHKRNHPFAKYLFAFLTLASSIILLFIGINAIVYKEFELKSGIIHGLQAQIYGTILAIFGIILPISFYFKNRDDFSNDT